MTMLKTVQELEAICDTEDLTAATEAVGEYFSQTTQGGQFAEDRAWLALRIAVLWLKEEDTVVATVWTHRALIEGPRPDAYCLLGEIAIEERDYPLAAQWYALACQPTPCPSRCLSGFMKIRRARMAELRPELPWRPVLINDTVDPQHMLIVMTCEGREASLKRTLASLDAAGAHAWKGNRVVLCDGNVDSKSIVSYGWRVSRKTRSGQAQTFFTALALGRLYESTSVTVFEDDVVLAKNALLYIARVKQEDDVAFTSWFTRGRPREPHALGGWWMTEKLRGFTCNQAITIPQETIGKILDSDQCRKWSEPHGADMIFSQVIPDALVARALPDIVDHIPVSSMVGTSNTPRSGSFVGEDFDALRLFDR